MLPTGLTYSSLAKRFIPSIANGTCGVGRRVFRSISKRAARRDADCGSGSTIGKLPRSVSRPGADSLPRERCRAAIPCSGQRGGATATDNLEPEIDGATLCSSSSALKSNFFTVDFFTVDLLSSKFRGVALTGPRHCNCFGERVGSAAEARYPFSRRGGFSRMRRLSTTTTIDYDYSDRSEVSS